MSVFFPAHLKLHVFWLISKAFQVGCLSPRKRNHEVEELTVARTESESVPLTLVPTLFQQQQLLLHDFIKTLFPCPQVIRITVVFHLQPPRFLPPHHSPPKLRLMAAHGCSYLIHNTAGRLLQGCGGSRAAAQPADAGPIAKLSHKWLLVITHRSTLRNGEMTFQLQSNSKLHSIFCNRPKTISSFHSLPSDSYLSLPCPLSLGNISFPFSSAAQVSGNVCAVWFSLVFQ